jgi:uncharacterized protein
LSSPDNPQLEPQAPVPHESHVGISNPPDPMISGGDAPNFIPTPPPVEDPVWSGWDVLLVTFLTLVAMVILPIGAGLVAHAFFYPHTGVIELLQGQPTLLLISQLLIDAAWAILIFLLIEGKYHTHFWQAIHWNWPKTAWVMLGLGAVTFIGLAMLGNLLPMPKETPFDKLFDRTRDAYLLSIFAVTLGPFVEELFFRGFLYPVLARRWGVAWGIILAALPFALLHLQQYGFSVGIIIIIFAVGVVCGIVRATTKSLGASFLVHAGYNGAQMLIAVVFTHGFTRMPKGLLEFCRL